MAEGKDTYIVRVMNVSTDDVTMDKNTTIGYLLPIKQQVDSPPLQQQMTASEGLSNGCRAGTADEMVVSGSPVEKDKSDALHGYTLALQLAGPGNSFNIDYSLGNE